MISYRVDRARERRFDTVRECGDDALARLKEPRHGSRDRVLDRGDSIRERRLDGCEPFGHARGYVRHEADKLVTDRREPPAGEIIIEVGLPAREGGDLNV